MRSMAIAGSSSPYVTAQKSAFVTNHVLKGSQIVPFKKAASLKFKSSLETKAFEDKFEGIICYRDENGEMVCEGYDEGPRFHPRIPRASFHPRGPEFRDAEIMNMVLQRWNGIVNGVDDESNCKGKDGVAVQEDINWNGYNNLF